MFQIDVIDYDLGDPGDDQICYDGCLDSFEGYWQIIVNHPFQRVVDPGFRLSGCQFEN